MATTFTGLSEAKMDEVIIGSIQAMLPYFGAFSTQLDHPEGLVKGNTYIVPVIGDLTVADKTPGTLVTPSGSVSGVNVVVNAFKGAAFEAVEGEISRRLLAAWWEKQVAEAAKAVAQQCVDAALALVTADNFGDTSADKVVQALNGFSTATLADIRAAARKKLKNVPGAFLCNPDVGSKLVTLEQLVYALAIAGDKDVISSGEIPGSVVGYPAFEYVGFPGNSEHLVAAVIGKSALAIAAGAPEQILSSGDGEVTYRRVVTEPDSGLSIQYTEAVNAGGKVIAELGLLYGVKKAQNSVIRLVTE